ncbi:MAG: hypothetical protein ACXAAH_16450 [Promethearchaeota archaeon]|jgi:hypothetical protein
MVKKRKRELTEVELINDYLQKNHPSLTDEEQWDITVYNFHLMIHDIKEDWGVSTKEIFENPLIYFTSSEELVAVE